MALSPSLNYPLSRYDECSAGRQTDDIRLVALIQRGDVEAFNVLVERYQHRVYTVCVRMLGTADAEDATQDVFLSAFRGIQLYRGGSFLAWLLRITTNTCLDDLRRRRRRPSISLDTDARGADDATALRIQDGRDSPEQRVLRVEQAQDLERWILELPAEQRLVLILSDIEGYSHQAIMAATGWHAGTVKSRLSRARARLRAALQHAGR